MSLAPKTLRPITRPAAPSNITQVATEAFPPMICSIGTSDPASVIASLIAASGQMALATSLAPCANDNNATAQIRGILNNVFIKLLEFLK